MCLLNWSDPESTSLNIANIVLGGVVVLCVVIMLGGVVHEFISRMRRRRRIDAELDRDMCLLNDDPRVRFRESRHHGGRRRVPNWLHYFANHLAPLSWL